MNQNGRMVPIASVPTAAIPTATQDTQLMLTGWLFSATVIAVFGGLAMADVVAGFTATAVAAPLEVRVPVSPSFPGIFLLLLGTGAGDTIGRAARYSCCRCYRRAPAGRRCQRPPGS